MGAVLFSMADEAERERFLCSLGVRRPAAMADGPVRRTWRCAFETWFREKEQNEHAGGERN